MVSKTVIVWVGLGIIIFVAILRKKNNDSLKAGVAADNWNCSLIGRCPDDPLKAGVAADNWNCSLIGRDILQRGGSAVDGAIAALLCTSVMNAQSAGIGGGSIFTVMDSSGKVKIINSRETVPRNFNPDLLQSCQTKPKVMPDWIGVPGEIRGYAEAHRLYGKLPWPELFKPTIKLAREGFPIPQIQGQYISDIDTNKTLELRKLYLENGKLRKTGDIMKFEKLADTLEAIANHGPEAFYSGRIAEDLIRDVRDAGGILTLEDLAEYKVTVTDAWNVSLGDYKMHIPPPPAGGAILAFIMNVMKGYHLNSGSLTGENKIQTYHRYVEAFKFANGLLKNFYNKEKAKKLITDSSADRIRDLITDKTHDPQYYNISVDDLGSTSTSTTHVSVLAEDGSAVSVTSTINHIFGSQIFSPRTGVILNNQLSDFCDKIDRLSPGEQPPSFMAPAVLKSRSNTLVIGGSGGRMITTGIASALMNRLWFGKSLEEAIAARVVFVNRTHVEFEPSFDEDFIKGFKVLGHKQKPAEKFFNVVNAVEKVDGCISAVSDKRKNGKAACY